jgi:branched-chain amino acid transport system substrate-binding protein
MFEPDMLKTMSPELFDGTIGAVGSWGSKDHEAIIAELKSKYNEPWMTQNGVSTYADMLVIRDALEKAGKADRESVAEALHTMDGGPSKYYPGGSIKFGPDGRREGASLTIIQWQNGVPLTIYPPDLAMAKANCRQPRAAAGPTYDAEDIAASKADVLPRARTLTVK